ncbi:MAG: hypothetical protein A2W82_01420 [Sulfurimonas sp. RIFCSPLOWO2_12_36_12]|uniref:hypothetical protein n=1 Tax=Sulfurimonas sp. RIFCSPLOWO2_12_36_12 TaxID=1802253 RepID=UPI0008B06B5D|nr:hypothetical protein [Sulfurimonas sp. RIFCSPLOWO2_12_36_12]OHD99256.1 MAG: hypothetical protein A3J26_04480 [Sulfurimonas sp. RIFCSPLOWO2_02_FULL_36_28]OHE03003.1 MAG: hypothetical protein A2W82_01420 [Sulfurimonas sp. RIFCSPLOWO2_12_36_12]
MNVEGLMAISFAIGLGAEFIVNKVGSGIMAGYEMITEDTSVISDVNSSIVDINTTIDLNSTIDANASLVVSVLSQLSILA